MTTVGLYNRKYFIESGKFQRDPIRLQSLFDAIMKLSPTSVLDVGCGRGFLVRKLNDYGVYTLGVDFSDYAVKKKLSDAVFLADAKKIPFGGKSFDLVVSTDFFEHIPEEDIDKVYSEMKRVSNRVAARIAMLPESPKVNEYHLTIRDRGWWLNKCEGIILL